MFMKLLANVEKLMDILNIMLKTFHRLGLKCRTSIILKVRFMRFYGRISSNLMVRILEVAVFGLLRFSVVSDEIFLIFEKAP